MYICGEVNKIDYYKTVSYVYNKLTKFVTGAFFRFSVYLRAVL